MPRRPFTLLLALLAAAAALPAAAHADPPWSPPVPVEGTGGYGTPVVFTAAGNGVTLTPADRSTGTSSRLTPLGDDGTPGAPQGLDPASGLLATYAQNRIVVAGSSVTSPGVIGQNSATLVAFGTPGGVATPRALPGTTHQRPAALAADARGDVALVTLGGTGSARDRVVWVRRAGGSGFAQALRIHVGTRARDATVAVGPKGDLLVVWEDDHEIFARHRGARSWGSVHRLGPGVQSQLQAAIDDTGRLLVAWVSERVSEGDTTGPAIVSFATAAPGHGFGARRIVETVAIGGTGRYVSAPGVRVAVMDGGRAALAWTGANGDTFVTRYADVDHGHRQAPIVLSPPDAHAVLGDLAVTPGGSVLVAWRLGVAGADPAPGATPRVMASTRAAGARAFGAPEGVSDPAVMVPYAPSVALDARTRRALAVFAPVFPGAAQVAARAPIAP
jgi:hypothetical protein